MDRGERRSAGERADRRPHRGRRCRSRPAEPPPTVIFSAPCADDADVDRGCAGPHPVLAAIWRRQSVAEPRAVTYDARRRPSRRRPPPPAFTATYQEATRSIEIKFAQPLERFQTVKVELLEGITATRRPAARAVDADVHDRRRLAGSQSGAGSQRPRNWLTCVASSAASPRGRSRSRTQSSARRRRSR